MRDSDPLTEAFLRAVRAIQSASGYGRITVTLKLEREPEIETAISERVMA